MHPDPTRSVDPLHALAASGVTAEASSRTTWSRQLLNLLLLIVCTLGGLGLSAPTLAEAKAEAGVKAPDPMTDLAWLIGAWRSDFKPLGEDRGAATLLFEWGPERSYLRFLGTQPSKHGGVEPEHESFLFWHPTEGRFELRSIYFGAGTGMLETGRAEILDDGALLLHMQVHYAAGRRLPFSGDAVAGAGGHTLEFRRTLRPAGEDGIHGTFFLKRGGRWENPHPELKRDVYPWSRISEPSAKAPEWARQHMASQVAGDGRWIASNAAYQGPGEAADAYGLEWQWTLGEHGIRGRLFSLVDGEEVGTHWRLHTFWHPGEGRLITEQFGTNGAMGFGSIRDLGNGAIEIEQTFYAPDGTSSKILHRSTFDGLDRVGTSFTWADGAWQENRTYTWRQPAAGEVAGTTPQ